VIRLAIRVPREHAELVLAELLELAPSGVEEAELPELPELRAAAGGVLIEVISTEVPDDWSERWREFHQPLVLGDRLTVRPPWEPAGATALDVVIDPAQAFGTGAHATTRLCLELMLKLEPSGSVLDLGSGSGVLAITAAKLGFTPVCAADFDPLSVAATRQNAAVNRVALEARRLDLRHDPLPEADTVLANLLSPLLRTLAARLSEGDPRSRPRRLLASGLLEREADELAAAFGSCGLIEVERAQRAEWVVLRLEQPM